mgnify:CR=1 FL=1
MRYVVMVSHGDFAPGLHSAVQMMTGKRDDVLSTSLRDGMGTDEFSDNFTALISGFTEEDEVILLADILSGSPFTNALRILDEKGFTPRTLVIAGMNMPLAITAVLMNDKRYFLITKNPVDMAEILVKHKFVPSDVKRIVIGPCNDRPGSIKLGQNQSLIQPEAEACEAMTNAGYDVYFALLEETAIGSWPKFRSKFGY